MNDRARVPFALLGVLLLASSAALAPALNHQADTGRPSVDAAMDRLHGQVQTAVRTGIETAARESARDPVLDAANTSAGRVLNDSNTFRDSLRIRIYAAVQDALHRTATDRRGLDLTATLPPVDGSDDLREAKRRVTLARGGPNGSQLRVSIRNVTLEAERDGRVVGGRTLRPTVLVPNPVLAVHDRVTRYERLLDNGPLNPGLGRRLTAMLYAVTWARGYAQYRNLPVENVVANRHVSLLTNDAVLSLQERVFGGSDPLGRATYVEMLAFTGVLDVLSTDPPAVLSLIDDVREGKLRFPSVEGERAVDWLNGSEDHGDPRDKVTVGVNQTADRAFVDVVERINETVEETYTADARLTGRVRERRGSLPEKPLRPEENVTFVRELNTTSASVSSAAVAPVDPAGHWHVVETYPRSVELHHEWTRVWRDGTDLLNTTSRSTETVSLSLQVEGYHSNGPAPDAAVRTVHERGGPLDGPNMEAVEPEAVRQLVTESGGPDELAGLAARRDWEPRTTRIQGDLPDGIYPWIYRDIAALRERVRALSVDTTKGKLATFQAEPARRLAAKLDRKRYRFAPIPPAYGSIADRARIGVRLQFVDATVAAMRDRAESRRRGEAKLNESMRSEGDSPMRTLQGAYEKRNDWRALTPAGLEMRVHASPSYLTMNRATHEDLPALAPNDTLDPLVVRNFNLFTLPFGAAADALASAALGEKHVRLKTGIDVLEAVETLDGMNGSLADRVRAGQLRAEMKTAVDYAGRKLGGTLSVPRRGTVGAWQQVVESAVATYPDTLARANAFADGSIAPRVTETAAKRWPKRYDAAWRRDFLTLRTRQHLRSIRREERAGPTQPTTNESTTDVKAVVKDELRERLAATMRNATLETLRATTDRNWPRPPAGVPVMPTLTPWYATVNAWHVEVGGEYARFAVTVPRGTPVDPGGSFAYVRDGSNVTADVLPGGGEERLGRAARVSFRTDTWIGLAVPPGGPGVGDVDGVQDERSQGWPDP